MYRETLASLVRRLFPRGGILAFGSFGHGHGRSTLADEVFKALKRAGTDTIRLSTGIVFRRIAKSRGFSDLIQFSQYLEKNPSIAQKIDFYIDREVVQRLREHKGNIVVLDSNLHVHPAILRDVLGVYDFFTFYVHTPDDILGKRLLAKSREGERAYSSWIEAVQAQRKRTVLDIARYITYAGKVNDQTLRRIYNVGARIMARLYLADVLFDDPLFLARLAKKLNRSTRIAVVDNSESIEESVNHIKDALSDEVRP